MKKHFSFSLNMQRFYILQFYHIIAIKDSIYEYSICMIDMLCAKGLYVSILLCFFGELKKLLLSLNFKALYIKKIYINCHVKRNVSNLTHFFFIEKPTFC